MVMPKHVDSAQQESLDKIEKLLKAGKLKNVRNTADFWTKYTSVEIDFIIRYKRSIKNE